MKKLNDTQKEMFRRALEEAMEKDFYGFTGQVFSEGSTKYILEIKRIKTAILPSKIL